MENSRARHVALLQPYGETFLEIDSRKQDHGDHFRKFAIKARPETLALFRVKLRADHVVAPDDGGERAAIVRLRDQVIAICRFQFI